MAVTFDIRLLHISLVVEAVVVNEVAILDQNGNPFISKPSKASMIAGGGGLTGSTPRDASDNYSQRMGDWQPFLWSPDSEINIWRDRIVSRSRDIVRNDGWASGAITRTIESICLTICLKDRK